jgi:hypothetical protein
VVSFITSYLTAQVANEGKYRLIIIAHHPRHILSNALSMATIIAAHVALLLNIHPAMRCGLENQKLTIPTPAAKRKTQFVS